MAAMRMLHRIVIFAKSKAVDNKFIVAPVVALLTSCALNDPAVISPYEQMVPQGIRKHHRAMAELEFVTFNISDKLEEPKRYYHSINRNEITYLSEQWKLALIKTLDNANIFESDSKTKLSLTVTVSEASSPIFAAGADFKARYQITDMKTGVIVYSKDIRTNDRLPWLRFQKFGDDGTISLLEAEELVINENIKEFMNSIDVDKLVVPQKTE
jgi:hypothetical protein